jgi:hypothetical protein
MVPSRKSPQANAVARTSEEITYASNLFKSGIFGQYIPNLVHCGTPTETLIQMIKDFDCIDTAPFTNKFVHFFSKPLGTTQATASKLRR